MDTSVQSTLDINTDNTQARQHRDMDTNSLPATSGVDNLPSTKITPKARTHRVGLLPLFSLHTSTEVVTQTTLCLLGLRRTIPARMPSMHTPAQHNSHLIPTHTTPQGRYPSLDDPLCTRHQNQSHHTIPRKPKVSSHRHGLTPSAAVAMATTLYLQCMIPSQALASCHTQAVRQTRTASIRA